MKILVADFDRTLYTDSYQENIEIINGFVNKGNIFIIATGRNLYSIKPELDKKLKFSYLICNDGGTILDRDFNVIYRKDIIDEVINPLFDELMQNPYIGNPLIDLSERYEYKPCKGANAIIARIIDREKTKQLLEDLLIKYPAITGYLSDRWINIDDQSISKGNAIKTICYQIKYDYEDVYAIGDNLNDISMCEICNGFAIKDSSLELQAVSKGIVTDIKELVEML